MKKSLLLLLQLSFFFSFLMSCKKDDDKNPSGTPQYGSLTMQSDGTPRQDTANGMVNKIDNIITISSTFSIPALSYDKILLTVSGSTVGSYTSNSSQNLSEIKYILNGVEYLSTNSSSGGTIHITSIDTMNWKLSGTFSGNLSDGSGNGIAVSNGVFTNVSYWEPKGGGGTPTIVKNVSADINSLPFMPTGVGTTAKGGRVVVSAYKDYTTITLDMPLSPPGTYTISNSSSFKAHYSNSGSRYQAQTGQVTITSHDFVTNTIAGTFYFTTTNGVVITNGTFSVVY